MNQERFDEITRALGTKKFSRRQALKALGAGALLSGSLGALAAPASAKRKHKPKKKKPYAPLQTKYTTSPVAHVQASQVSDTYSFTSMEGWLTIHKPVFDPDPPTLPFGFWYGTKHHSVGQLALYNQDATNSHPPAAIEFGWIVVPSTFWLLGFPNYHDTYLLLGVRGPDGHFKLITEDNQYGFHINPYWQQYPSFYGPGDNISDLVAETCKVCGPAQFSIEYIHDNPAFPANGWWLWFANQYIGYIDPNWFTNNGQVPAFTGAQKASWYGEVGSTDTDNDQTPCVPMGNGTYGTAITSARIERMAVNYQPANPYIDLKEHPQYWDGVIRSSSDSSYKTLYYGGPGKCG